MNKKEAIVWRIQACLFAAVLYVALTLWSIAMLTRSLFWGSYTTKKATRENGRYCPQCLRTTELVLCEECGAETLALALPDNGKIPRGRRFCPQCCLPARGEFCEVCEGRTIITVSEVKPDPGEFHYYDDGYPEDDPEEE